MKSWIRPGGHHHLAGRSAPPVRGAHQALSDDALERAGEHRAHLAPLVRWEEVYHAVDRLGGVHGVERGED